MSIDFLNMGPNQLDRLAKLLADHYEASMWDTFADVSTHLTQAYNNLLEKDETNATTAIAQVIIKILTIGGKLGFTTAYKYRPPHDFELVAEALNTPDNLALQYCLLLAMINDFAPTLHLDLEASNWNVDQDNHDFEILNMSYCEILKCLVAFCKTNSISTGSIISDIMSLVSEAATHPAPNTKQ